VGVPIILRANGQENAISFSLSYNTNAYSNPAFLTIYSNAVINLTLTQPGVAGLALTLPADETFRAGYRFDGIMRFDLAAGYQSVQGGLAFLTNPVPIAAFSAGAGPLPISASIQPQRVLSTSNPQLNSQSGLFEQRLVIGNPSAEVMTNLNIAVYGLSADSSSNGVTFFNAQTNLVTCPLNDCAVYVECDCSCDFYDPFWGYCYGYAYCSDNDCNTYVTGTTVSTPYAQVNNLLPGESREVTLEFYVTDHLTVPKPLYSISRADPIVTVVLANSTPVTIVASRYTADHVFLVAGLLTDEKNPGVRWPLAEHRLGCRFMEMAAPTRGCLPDRLPQRGIRMLRQHDRTQRRSIGGPWRFVQGFRLGNRCADARIAQQAGVMRVPPGLQRVIVRNVPAIGALRKAKLSSVPVAGAVRRQDGECQVGEPPRDELRVRLQHKVCRFIPAEVAGAIVLTHWQIAYKTAHPVCLSANRESVTLDTPHLRIAGFLEHALAGIGAPDEPIQKIEPLRLISP
jgi:hypothetical protein